MNSFRLFLREKDGVKKLMSKSLFFKPLLAIVKRYLFVLLSLLFVVPAQADDLKTIYDLATRNDPEFQAARSEYLALQEEVPISRSALLPQLSISGYVSDTDQEVEGGLSDGPYDYKNNGYRATLTQPIYQKVNFANLDQAHEKVSEAQATFVDAEQALILRVATQYFQVLAAKDNLKFAKAEKKAIKEQLAQSKHRFSVGLTAVTDVHEAKARFDQAVASEIEAQNTMAISNESLHEITGEEHSVVESLMLSHPLVAPSPSDINVWIKTALSKNSILKKAAKRVDITRFEVSKNQSGHYPSLDLTAEYSYDDFGDGSINPHENSETRVTLQLNVPLYQGGGVSARSRAASHRLQQAKDLLEKQRRTTIRQTRNAYLSVIANISQVKALKQALESTRIALEATQAGFDVGTRTGVDVLNSQRERYRASRDYARARYNYFLQTLQLKYAAGTLSQNDLFQINNWLN